MFAHRIIDLSRYHWVARVDAWLERALSRLPDLIIANSHAGKHHALARGLPAAKMIVIPNGVDLTRFQRDESSANAFGPSGASARRAADWPDRADRPAEGPADLPRSRRPGRPPTRADVRFVIVGNDHSATRIDIDALDRAPGARRSPDLGRAPLRHGRGLSAPSTSASPRRPMAKARRTCWSRRWLAVPPA